MKNLLYFSLILILTIATSCQKQHVFETDKDLLTDLPILTGNTLAHRSNRLFEIAKTVMPESVNKRFRSSVYSEIEKQFDGDYNVLVNKLSINEQNEKLSSLVNDLEQLQDYPQIYIPFYADLKNANRLGKEGPILVINDHDETVNAYPGYILNEKGELEELDFLITEEYAKEKEIWVIGLNERMNVDNLISVDPKDIKDEGDLQLLGNLGPDIYIGSIMVPNLGAIEPWISGKVELVVRVLSGSGMNLLQYDYGKIKRSKLDDQKWMNLNTYVTEWVPNLGDNLIVHWTELDGGNTTQTVTVTFPPIDGSPGASYNFQIKSDDDNLGFQICQKTQSSLHTYNTGLIQWKVLKVF